MVSGWASEYDSVITSLLICISIYFRHLSAKVLGLTTHLSVLLSNRNLVPLVLQVIQYRVSKKVCV